MIIPRKDLLSFLSKQTQFPLFYLKEQKHSIERVAIGATKLLSSPLSISRNCYGIVPFSPFSNAPPLFFLPKIEIIQTETETSLYTSNEDSVFFDAPFEFKKQSSFNSSSWSTQVETILSLIHQNVLSKVVLANTTSYKCKTDSFQLVKALSETATNSTVFACWFSPDLLFLGASPECLYRRKGKSLTTEALAGTRIISGIEDQLQFQKSAKELSEVLIVRDYFKDILSDFCTNILIDETPHLFKTSNLSHLKIPIQATLKELLDDRTILSLLHPSPAVCGFPKKEALKLISSLEPFDRRYYAGALGFSSDQESCFTVAIRSGTLYKGLLQAFSGAGIVKGSNPYKEWEEIQNKLSTWDALCSQGMLHKY